jgi:hypothetical protein
MITRRILNRIVAVVLVATALSSAPARAQGGGKARIEGTWKIVLTVPGDGFQLTALLTFAAGRSPNEGTLITTNDVDSFACSPSQGTWERTGRREFAVTHSFFCFTTSDPAGERDGAGTFRETVKVADDGQTLTGIGAIEFFGADGTSLGVTEYVFEGTRLAAR